MGCTVLTPDACHAPHIVAPGVYPAVDLSHELYSFNPERYEEGGHRTALRDKFDFTC